MNLNITMLRKKLERDGYLVINSFYKKKDIDLIKEDFFLLSKKLFTIHIKKKVNFDFKKDGFDAYINYAHKKKYEFNSKFYEVVKKLPSFYNLILSNKNFSLLKKLKPEAKWGVMNKALGFRFDYPKDKVFLTQMHQDYTSNLGAKNGLVFISPLSSITKNLGQIKIYPKTHKLGIQKIKISNKKNIRETRKYLLADEKKLKKTSFKSIPLKSTDLLVIDFLTLHESSYNFSNKTRITFISRYIDLNCENGLKIFFSDGEQAGNYFSKVHKDMTVY